MSRKTCYALSETCLTVAAVIYRRLEIGHFADSDDAVPAAERPKNVASGASPWVTRGSTPTLNHGLAPEATFLSRSAAVGVRIPQLHEEEGNIRNATKEESNHGQGEI